MINENGIQTNPVKVIRLKCLECCLGSSNEVALCTCEDCPLFAFRFGRNPYRNASKISDEQKAILSARMKAMQIRTQASVGAENESEHIS